MRFRNSIRFDSNYHCHSSYCDGKKRPGKYAQIAFDGGMKTIGFSSHAPLPFKAEWAMKKKDLETYFRDIEDLKSNYAGKMEIYAGLEVDYIPRISSPQSRFIRSLPLDYTIGSVHFVDKFRDGAHFEIDGSTTVFQRGLGEIFHGDIRLLIKRYYSLIRKMLERAPPDILGHIDKIKIHNRDKRFFDEKAAWYQEEVLHTLEVLSATPTILEVNTRGFYKNKTSDLYPSQWILQQAAEMGIPVTIDSDAHHPNELSLGFEQALEAIKKAGFDTFWVLSNFYWKKRKVKHQQYRRDK